MKKHQKYILVILFLILITYRVFKVIHSPNKRIQEYNKPICENLINKLENTDNFDQTWLDNNNFNMTDNNCSAYSCICPKAWDLFLKNAISKSQKELDKGLISTAYNEIKEYTDEKIVKDFYNKHDLFKLISGKDKEKISGVTASYGRWTWHYLDNSSFVFNKTEINDNSSTIKLNFEDSENQLLITGYLKPIKHPNWNASNDLIFDWYNYKIIDNIIYIKLTSESDNKYDKIFEIIKITDTSLSLKLLIDLDDVDANQIYNFEYKRV